MLKKSNDSGDLSHIFNWPVRVYYEDTDVGGIVYYANYLRFMERARTEWLRARGYEQDILLRQQRLLFAVRSIAVDYLKPALFNELLDVSVTPQKIGRASIDLAQDVSRTIDGVTEVLATGKVRLACLKADSHKPSPVPAELFRDLQEGSAR